jgi:hypothetical protein
MNTSPHFLDRLGGQLQVAYLHQASLRRRRRITLLVVVATLAIATGASAAAGVFDGFVIGQDTRANIVGSPPPRIRCSGNSCASLSAGAPEEGGWIYDLSHLVGSGLPTSGHLEESQPGQAVFDQQGKELMPPAGAELSYGCTTIRGPDLECVALSHFSGTLPRGTAVYVLARSEYSASG